MRVDLVGKQFGRLVVQSYDHTAKGKTAVWKCLCDPAKGGCGNIVYVMTYNLTNGNTKSCGCLQKEKSSRIARDIGTTHGLSHTRIYHIHRGMIDRCYSKNHDNYYRYGARGIYIVPEWYTPGVEGNPGFVNFYNWAMENGYDDSLTIDRKDNDDPYAPWNCQWVSTVIQENNKSTTQYITDGDELLSWSQMARKYNSPTHYIKTRVYWGWSRNAIIHGLKYPELNLRYHKGEYYDKDGFMALISNYGNIDT